MPQLLATTAARRMTTILVADAQSKCGAGRSCSRLNGWSRGSYSPRVCLTMAECGGGYTPGGQAASASGYSSRTHPWLNDRLRYWPI